VDLDVSHVSCYALSYDDGTPLQRDVQAGREQPMPDEMQEALYDMAVEVLSQAGFEHYELSNFARASRASRHNQVYWRNEACLGVGPAAASYVNGVRSVTCEDLGVYVDCLWSGRLAPAASERLTGRAHMGETVMLALRLIEGIDREAFARRFGLDVVEAFPASVGRHLGWGSIELTERRLRLARSAFFVADAVLADFLSEV
jgi:oxygen-independent coproporphyrinogen-3 oxidase